ncbi:oxygenase MpaB family protein [Nocardia seriolae]|uniref:oxygenase MpaB family protein n=1 Tax=Nocardia seriolae TaxID=37332 RepID=UPI002952F303|nr:oxygenase MpaB family protein [Nocardia seriolae]BEK87473.1 oxygenase MpaB family protein [Nocardia seriolae]
MTFDPTTLRREDYGFFGPDSPSWKVWTSPTAVIGFQRAVTLEFFDPFLTASVADTGKIYADPRGRLDATFAYFLIVAIGDSRTAIQASEHLMSVHAKSTGIEPITGQRYSPNSPETQLWIHITGWQSVLKAYEMFGPGLPPEEEARYWQECRIAAELQTCKPEDVPVTREGIREYYANVRARLCTSERAQEGMRQMLFTSPGNGAGWTYALGARLLSFASIATLPRWMRKLGGYDRPAIVDFLVKPVARILVWLFTLFNKAGLIMAAPLIAPMAGQILEQHLKAEAPTHTETVTPTTARELYGSRGHRNIAAAG